MGAAMKAREPWLRELGLGKYDVLDTVVAGLSPTSRFHSGLTRLTPRARERLDGRDHVAVAAFVGTDPVGIARLIALGDGRAELAVEVVDALQRRGIGRRLVRAVANLGRAAGMRMVLADVLAENVAMQLLFASAFPDPTVVADGPELQLTAALPGAYESRWAAWPNGPTDPPPGPAVPGDRPGRWWGGSDRIGGERRCTSPCSVSSCSRGPTARSRRGRRGRSR
jgi:GNAT superfamily N-acetyltransferase